MQQFSEFFSFFNREPEDNVEEEDEQVMMEMIIWETMKEAIRQSLLPVPPQQ